MKAEIFSAGQAGGDFFSLLLLPLLRDTHLLNWDALSISLYNNHVKAIFWSAARVVINSRKLESLPLTLISAGRNRRYNISGLASIIAAKHL